MNVILASASPRRQELLGYIFDSFECVPAYIDETLPADIAAENAAEYLAVKKAEHIAAQHPSDLVIGCDTVVLYGGRIFGKPKDEADARNMLRALSGKIHHVVTGVCMMREGKKSSFSDITEVEFYPLSDTEIDRYIATGSPMDKAGAYGIQDKKFLPVKRINGDYFNVVGLPAARLRREAESFLAR
ncbi:MAG: Maf family protein [Oscillospiraceae bacterium]